MCDKLTVCVSWSFLISSFWATVCQTVRPMLSERCLCVLSCVLSVTLVYCSQTVGWINCGQSAGCIKMPLGMEVGLRPGRIVLHGDPAPLPKGTQPPNFRPMSIVAKRLPISATAEHLSNLSSVRLVISSVYSWTGCVTVDEIRPLCQRGADNGRESTHQRPGTGDDAECRVGLLQRYNTVLLLLIVY